MEPGCVDVDYLQGFLHGVAMAKQAALDEIAVLHAKLKHHNTQIAELEEVVAALEQLVRRLSV